MQNHSRVRLRAGIGLNELSVAGIHVDLVHIRRVGVFQIEREEDMSEIAWNRANQAILKLREMFFSEQRRKGTLLEQIGYLLCAISIHRHQSSFDGVDPVPRGGEADTHQQPLIVHPAKPGDNVVAIVRRDDTVRVLSRDGLGIEECLSFMVPEHGEMPAGRGQLNGFNAGQCRKRFGGRRSGAGLGIDRYDAPEQ